MMARTLQLVGELAGILYDIAPPETQAKITALVAEAAAEAQALDLATRCNRRRRLAGLEAPRMCGACGPGPCRQKGTQP